MLRIAQTTISKMIHVNNLRVDAIIIDKQQGWDCSTMDKQHQGKVNPHQIINLWLRIHASLF